MPDMKILERNLDGHVKLKVIPNQQKYIQKYIGNAIQRKNVIRTKIHAQHIISRLLNKWQGKKLEHDAKLLQQEADKGNLIPIWQYQRALKGSKKQDRNYASKKLDGSLTKTPLERQQRWAEWIEQQFKVPAEQEIPKT